MFYTCEYDPKRDLQAVNPYGYMDLTQANVSSSVPSSLDSVDLQFNGIEDPNSILPRSKDAFEAAHLAKSVLAYKPKENNNAE